MGISKRLEHRYKRIKLWIEIKWNDFFHPYLTEEQEWKIQRYSVEWQRAAVFVSVLIAIIMLFTAIVTFGVSIATVGFSYITYKNTAIPNKASLTLLPIEKSDLVFGQSYMADAQPYSTSFEMCVTNNGRKPTGTIYFRAESDWAFVIEGHIKNIEGGHSDCDRIGLRCNGCSRLGVWDQEDINKSKLPPIGGNTLKLKVECDFCDPSTIEKELDVCIWSWAGNSGECDEFVAE